MVICYLFVVALLDSIWHSDGVQSTADLFPSFHEEYDPWILDPEDGFGSPFGGFSRATPSRLASLPLFLPNTESQDPNPMPFHTEVRDMFGRLYICRVYHEDELDPASLNNGMFEVPKLKQKQQSPQQPLSSPASKTSSQASNVNKIPSENLPSHPENNPPLTVENDGVATSAEQDLQEKVRFQIHTDSLKEVPNQNSESSVPIFTREGLKTKNEKELLELIDQRLAPLNGLCAQSHKGWWSYEWCYKDSVTQFHVEITKGTSSIQVHDITSLGDYESRKVTLAKGNNEPGLGDTKDDESFNHFAQGRPEIARVEDYYIHGTPCPGSDKERRSIVQLTCCSDAIFEQRRGLVHKDNVHVTTDLMIFYEVEESKLNLCTYNIVVCTPLLCEDFEYEEEMNLDSFSSSGGKLKDKNARPSPPIKENESVMEILERTLGGFCLQTATGGWWTYEICHKKSIRQYHEVIGTKKNKHGAVYTARAVEADHNLGKYQTNKFAAIVPEDEYKFVVNATDKIKSGNVKKAYFELEYIGGDVCDHSDVTDAAIVAGASSTTQKDPIRRASSVRYQCGESYDISVSEDSTCHYLVWVDLPDLCKHPLFKEPVSKRQVFKCLHVPEEMEDGVQVSWG